jgi:hypothetical protein
MLNILHYCTVWCFCEIPSCASRIGKTDNFMVTVRIFFLFRTFIFMYVYCLELAYEHRDLWLSK